MANINLNTGEIRKQASLLKEASQNLIGGTVKPIENADKDLEALWMGDSGKAFTKYMEELKASLKSNADDINKISTFLLNAAKAMEQADREAKSKIK